MLRKLNIIHLILLVVNLSVILIVGFICGFESPETFIAVLCTVLLGHPMIYLVMMLFKEHYVFDYDTPKFMPMCMVLTILLGCLIWYLFFNIDHIFAQSIGLWYGGVLLAFSIPIFVMKLVGFIVEKKKKTDRKGPKILKK